MSKRVEFVEAPTGIKIVMIDRPLEGTKVEKQFTVPLWQLQQALRAAGLYQKLVEPTPKPAYDRNNPADAAQLQAEIALYAALPVTGTTLTSYGKTKKDELWVRICAKLKL